MVVVVSEVVSLQALVTITAKQNDGEEPAVSCSSTLFVR